MEQKNEMREKREKLSVATAACDVLKALKSKSAGAAQELRKAVEDGKPHPSRLVREVHDALLSGMMDKRVKSTEVERKKLFGIPIEADLPPRSQMRALVKRFEQAFLRPSPAVAPLKT